MAIPRKSDPLLTVAKYIVTPFVTLTYISAYIGSILGFILLLAAFTSILCLKLKFLTSRTSKKSDSHQKVIAFFHPYCDAGGGGERVLWCGIRSIQKRFPAEKIVIYTGDVDSAPDQIIGKASQRFNIEINTDNLEFIYLHRRKWVEADTYPRFTLLGQSLGSMWLALEALEKCCPDVFLDTMGYAFALPIFKYFGNCKVGCYVHYPTISTDMLDKVRTRSSGFNNRKGIANSRFATKIKLIYYNIFAWMYGKAGACSDLTMVNSSWTEDHVNKLWHKPGQLVHKIYPPCDVQHFKELKRDPFEDEDDEEVSFKDDVKSIVSIGQFRPEKDHALQIRAMYELRELLTEEKWKQVKLILIGGSRNEEDEKRVQDLKDLCKHYSVEDNVEFRINVPFEELCQTMQKASIGLHSMWNEHFGIAVVEMLAAGLITIAHRSGGPLMDIVVEESNVRNGFLAERDKEYAAMISYILNLNPEGRQGIRERARSSVDRFSDRHFDIGWRQATEALISNDTPTSQERNTFFFLTFLLFLLFLLFSLRAIRIA